jgi:hypothetical protein
MFAARSEHALLTQRRWRTYGRIFQFTVDITVSYLPQLKQSARQLQRGDVREGATGPSARGSRGRAKTSRPRDNPGGMTQGKALPQAASGPAMSGPDTATASPGAAPADEAGLSGEGAVRPAKVPPRLNPPVTAARGAAPPLMPARPLKPRLHSHAPEAMVPAKRLTMGCERSRHTWTLRRRADKVNER